MMDMKIFTTTLNFFFLLTPFFVLLLFLDICKDKDKAEQIYIANKTALYIFGICILILFFGPAIFKTLGITLVAFQIGSGIVLFLSGLSMIQDNVKTRKVDANSDPALIPLTLPITVGPGTVGALFVLGSQLNCTNVYYTVCGIFFAVLFIWLLLRFSNQILKYIGHNGLRVLSKLTGLFLAILATQSVINGITTFLKQIR